MCTFLPAGGTRACGGSESDSEKKKKKQKKKQKKKKEDKGKDEWKERSDGSLRPNGEEEEEEEEEEGDESHIKSPIVGKCSEADDDSRNRNLQKKQSIAMGMYAFVDHFDNFNQFIRMSPDQCRLYGPEFVVRYAKLHAKLHAGIEAQCANPFSVLDDFGLYDVVDGEPEEEEEEEEEEGKVKVKAGEAGEPGARAEVEGKVEAGEAGARAAGARAEVEGKVEAGEAEARAEEEEEEGVHGDRVQPRSALRRSGGGDGDGLIPCMEQFCRDDGFNDAQTIQVCSHPVGTCDAIQRWSRRTELN
ncbi:hypothetical protein D5F01_LYC13316 [Larimichthys crocea]|uniref:Uncharacterized protein n=1 Tax=Larimichthys crocea TaxID=215358 RepID=A0A6G0I6W6_LARCR|nr:hypothetical protein D5F01_LYC13316 [Larimichthys crocea]